MAGSFSGEERIGEHALFAAVVAHGSLSAAGRALAISPPMVSKRLAALERRLGVRLIHRTTRRLALTEAGARFHEDVVAILTATAEAERRVSGAPGQPRGALRLSAPTSFGRLHVAPHLSGFLAACPLVDLTLDLSDAYSDLIGERIDLAIRITAAVPPDLAARRLTTSRRILCAAPAYLAQAGMPGDVAVLGGHRLLAADGQLPWRLMGPGGLRLVEGRSAVRTNSSEVVRELAVAGVGVALRSLWDVSHDLAAGRLVRVLADHEGSADVAIYAVHPRATLVSPNVTAMMAYLAALYDPVPPWPDPPIA